MNLEKYLRGRRFTLSARQSSPVIKIAQMQGNLMELVGNNPEHRNWKGMAIALLVILVVCGFIVLSVVLLTPEKDVPVVPKVSLRDVLGRKWKAGLEEVTWQDSGLVYRDVSGNVVMMTSPEASPKILIDGKYMKNNGIVDYKMSSDLLYALLIYDKTTISDYAYDASYFVYDIERGTKEPLIHDQSISIFRFAGFGPKGSQLLYSLDGDIYYKADAASPFVQQITTNGKPGTIQNGIADWLYEEEILHSSVAHWWSPGGQYLAYASFDNSKVPESYFTSYINQQDGDVKAYKETSTYRYPKAGFPNPVVNIHVVDLEDMDEVTLIRPTIHREYLDTFHSFTWLSEDELLLTWSNRTMTLSVMQQCFSTMPTCVDDVIHQQVSSAKASSNKKSGWLPHLSQSPLLSDEPGIFFYILPNDHGGMGSFRHLALFNKTAKPTTWNFLTEGNWEVTKLLHYDSSVREVYFVSNEENRGSRHVYKVGVDSATPRTCVTCKLSVTSLSNYVINSRSRAMSQLASNISMLTCGGKTSCRYYDAKFGTHSDWFALKCLGPCMPYSGVVRLRKTRELRNKDSRKSDDISNVRIIGFPSQPMENVVVPKISFGSVFKNGFEIRYKMLLPASIHVGKRPLVFFKEDLQSQTVDFKFKVDLASYIVTEIGAIVVFVDGHGSGFGGERRLQSVAGRPGELEIEDMKAVIEHLTENDERVNTKSVGVVGSSGYGGFTAILSLTHPEFKCGVARSPITDWSLYSSFGSEKILGSPSTDPLSYQKSNLLHLIEGIGESELKIYHAMQDQKVNMQHSVLLEQSAMFSNLPLEALQVTYYTSPSQFQSSIQGDKIESHICQSITSFLRNCLFSGSEQGRLQLELLNTNYGIET